MINEEVKWWKGKLAELILDGSLLPNNFKIDQKLNGNEFNEKSPIPKNLKKFLENFYVKTENIMFL